MSNRSCGFLRSDDMNLTKRIFIASFIILLPLVIHAQLISVQSRLSSDSMMIGDQLSFTIHVEADENVTFQLPVIRDTLSRDLEVLYSLSADTVVAEGRRVVDHTYMFTGFEQGMQMIPAIPILYSVDEISDTALSMPLIIRVYEPVVDTTQQIKPIKPPINTPVTFREVLPWIAFGIGAWLLVTLIFALVWMFREHKKDPEIFSIKPLEPAHVVAFRELDRLKEEKLWESGLIKNYYTKLTEISRQYIERQYGIPAMERTTDEILDAFRTKIIEEESRSPYQLRSSKWLHLDELPPLELLHMIVSFVPPYLHEI